LWAPYDPQSSVKRRLFQSAPCAALTETSRNAPPQIFSSADRDNRHRGA
jgi:hypothetical protein